VISIASPHDIVIVQVPDQWTPNQIQSEQDRLSNLIERERIQIKILIVPGGSNSWPQPSGSPVKFG
jgi:hypothetical protein